MNDRPYPVRTTQAPSASAATGDAPELRVVADNPGLVAHKLGKRCLVALCGGVGEIRVAAHVPPS